MRLFLRLLCLLSAVCLFAFGSQAAQAQTLSLSFDESSSPQQSVVTLTHLVENDTANPIDEISFTHTLPAGFLIAGPGTHDCSVNTVTAAPETNVITLTDAGLAPWASCLITTPVTVGTTLGSVVTATSTLSSSAGVSAFASASIIVSDVASGIQFTQAFSPATVDVNGVSTLTYTLANNTAGIQFNGFFSDTYADGLVLNTVLPISTDCTGSVTPNSATNSISVTDLFLVASGSCTISVPVRANSFGDKFNVSGELAFGPQSVGASSAVLRVAPLVPGALIVSKTYQSNPVSAGISFDTRYVIQNPSRDASTNNLVLADDFGAVQSTVDMIQSDTCGGSGSGAGTGSFSYSNGVIAPGASCEIVVRSTVNSAAVAGTYPQSVFASGYVDGVEVGSNAATDALRVEAGVAPVVAVDFVPATAAAGGPATYRYTITNPSATVPMNGIGITTVLDPAFATGATLPAPGSCGTGSSFGYFGGTAILPATLTVSGANLAADDSCSFDLVLNLPANAPAGPITQASGTVSSNDGTTSGNSDSATLLVNGGASLGAQFITSTPLVSAGGTASFEFTLSSGAESTATATGGALTLDINAIVPGAIATGLPLSDVCGTGSTLSGSSTLTLSGATLAPGDSCTFGFDVTIPAAASVANVVFQPSDFTATTGSETASTNTSGAAVRIIAEGVAPVTLEHRFDGGPFVPGESLTMELVYINPNAGTDLTLPLVAFGTTGIVPGLTSVGPVTSTNGCSLQDVSSINFVAVLNVVIPGGGTCTLVVPLALSSSPSSSPNGSFVSVIAAAEIDNGTAVYPVSASTATLNILAEQLGVSAAFSPAFVPAGQSTTLTYSFDNAAGQDVTNIIFDANVAGDLAGASVALLSDSCGFTNNSLTGTIDVTGGSVLSESTCSISFTVTTGAGTPTGDAAVTSGIFEFHQGAVTGLILAPATARLSVLSSTLPTLSKSFSSTNIVTGDALTIDYIISNPSTDLTRASFSDALGTTLPGATVTSISGSCGAGSSVSTGSTVSLENGVVGTGESCIFTATLDTSALPSGTYASATSDLFENGVFAAPGASDNLTVTQRLPTVSAAFSPATVSQGQQSFLTYTVDNSAGIEALSGLAFNTTRVATIQATTGLVLFNSCGGTVSVGATNLDLAGGAVAAGASCSFSISLNSTVVGDATVNFSPLSTSAGAVATVSSAAFTVEAAPVPTLSKSFSAASFVQGGTARLTYTVTNRSEFMPLSSIAFSDQLPAGLVLATPTNLQQTCGGSFTNTSGASALSLINGVLGQDDTCTVHVDVTGTQVGTFVSTTSDITSTLGTGTGAQGSIDITAAPEPTFTMAFSPATVVQGAVSTVTYTIDNSAALVPADDLGFANTFPAGMIRATPSNVTNSCGGAVSGDGNTDTLALSNGIGSSSVAAGAICTVTVDVIPLVGGALVNTTGALTSTLGSSGTASATLTSTPAVGPTMTTAFDPSTVVEGVASFVTFTLGNSALVPAENIAFDVTLPALLTVANPPVVGTTCPGGTVTAIAGTGSVGFSGASLASGSTCTVSLPVISDERDTYTVAPGSITSTLLTSTPTGADLTVNSAPAPVFSAGFAPASVPQGGTSTLTFSIDNSAAAVPSNTNEFAALLPAGMVFADPATLTTTCSGFSGMLSSGVPTKRAPGARSTAVAFIGTGSIAAGEVCTVSVNVVGLAVGDLSVDGLALFGENGVSPASRAILNVTAAPAPLLTQSFDPATVVQGATSTLTYTISNAAALIAADTISLTNALPAGLDRAVPLNVINTCGGVGPVASGGSGPITASGIALAAGSTCTIAIDVVPATSGDKVNDSGTLSTSLGDTSLVSATLGVTPAPVPTVVATLNPEDTVQGVPTAVTFEITNTALVDATSLSLSTTLPSRLLVADPTGASTTCAAGAVTALAGTNGISLPDVTLAAGTSCEVTVSVVSLVSDLYTVSSGIVTSSLGASVAATVELLVFVAPTPEFTQAYAPDTIVQGGTSTLTFTIDNTAAAIEANGLRFDVALPDGVSPVGSAVPTTTCVGGNLSVSLASSGLDRQQASAANGFVLDTGTPRLSYSDGTVPAGASCTITLDVTGIIAGNATNPTVSLLNSINPASALPTTLTVIAAPEPVLTADFTPATIEQGGVTTFSVTVDNSAALVPAENLSLDVPFLPGMSFAPAPNFTFTGLCAGGGGAITPTGVAITADLVPAGEICIGTFDAVLTEAGGQTLVTGDLTSTLGNSGPASASITVTSADVLTFSAAFDPATIEQGETAVLTYTMSNSALIPATDVTFADTFTDGLSIMSGSIATLSCVGASTPGALVGAAGGTGFTVSGGTIAAGDTCRYAVTLVATQGLTVSNTSGALSSSLGDSGTATAELSVTLAPNPIVTAMFVPDTIVQGGQSTLVLTIDSSAALVDVTDMALNVSFSPLVTTSGLNASPTTTCGAGTFGGFMMRDSGTMEIPVFGGLRDVVFQSGTVAAGGTCEVRIPVQTIGNGDVTASIGALSSSQGVATSGSEATLLVTPAPVPDFAQAFVPDTIEQGGDAIIEFTITNADALVAASDFSFTYPLPAGFTLTEPNVVTNTCQGILDLSTGTSVTYLPLSRFGKSSSFAIIPIGGLSPTESCVVSVGITATTADAGLVTAPELTLTSSLGESIAPSALLTVTGAELAGFTKAFSPDTIVQGEVSTLTLTFDNSAALIAATDGAVIDTLPAGMTVAPNPGITHDCTDASITAAAGAGSVDISGVTIAAGASCTIAVNVTSATVGAAVNLTDILTTSFGEAGTATATLQVNSAPVLDFLQAFVPATIVQGDVSRLTYTFDNTGALVEATNISFSDTFPTGLVVATQPGAEVSCGAGTLTAVAGADTVAFDGGTLAAGETCSVSVNVSSPVTGTFENESSALVSDFGTGGTSAAALEVTGADAPGFAGAFAPDSFVQGASSVLTYTITNDALVAATEVGFSTVLPAGLTVATPSAATTTCGSGIVTATDGGDTFDLADGAVAAGATCSVSLAVTSDLAAVYVAATGDLSSNLGISAGPELSVDVTAADAPGFVGVFAPDSFVQGASSVLTYTITNDALVDATGAAFTTALPAGLVVATPAGATTTCGSGTVTANDGGDTFALVNGVIAEGTSCSVSLAVTSDLAATYVVATGDLSSNIGVSAGPELSIDVTAADAPGFAKSFAPSTILQGVVTTLTYEIDNTSSLVAASEFAFTESFASGLTFAETLGVSSSCAVSSIGVDSGTNVFTVSDGEVPAGEICTVSVNMTGLTVGSFDTVSGDLTSSLGNSGTAAASLEVGAAPPPTLSQFFSIQQITQGGVTQIIITIDNSGAGVPASLLQFLLTLPPELQVVFANGSVAPISRVTNSCGGTVTATPGSSEIGLSGGEVAAGATCTVSVDVTSSRVGTLAPATGTLTSSLGASSLVLPTNPLVVLPNPGGNVSFVQNSDEDGAYVFASSQSALNFTINTNGGFGAFGPVTVPVGTYTVTQARPTGVGNTSVSCSDGDSTIDQATGTLTLRVASNETVICTYSSITTLTKTVETINSFLNRRNNLILSNGPDRGRRMDRLSQGVGRSETLAFQDGDLGSMMPFTFNFLSLGSGSYSTSTSLNQVRRAGEMFRLAHDGDAEHTTRFMPSRFDVWFEAQYSKFEGSQGSGGHFGIAYLGADYLVTEDVLAGVVLQYDTLKDSSATTNSTVDGTGWMIGPYVTARIGPNLIFDGRLAYGQSDNDISPFNTYTDTFETDRWLIDASLSGNYDWGDWIVSPNVGISYIEERQGGYTDSLNVAIPSQKVSLGQIKFGPTFSTRYDGANHSVIEPSFKLTGIYNFGNRSGAAITNNTADESDGLRARVEGGVKITNRHGARFEFGLNYDGIGAADFKSYGARFSLSIPTR